LKKCQKTEGGRSRLAT